MTTIAMGAVRSCGLTTLALALAATWPDERQVLLCECDPAGGTIAAAAGWAPEPGMVSLAAAARRDSDPEEVWMHIQEMPNGAAVLAGPVSSDQSASALAMLAGLLGRLGELSSDVLIDCGRLLGSFTEAIGGCADQLVLAARPALVDLHAVAAWCEAHTDQRDQIALVLVGDGPYSNAEVSQALDMPVLARLPWDPPAAASLLKVPATARELSRSALVRSARSWSHQLSGQPLASVEGETVSVSPPSRRRMLRRGRTVDRADSAKLIFDELSL
jgi:hypothetical protein